MAIHVISPGPRTTIQDGGRLGYQNSGFAPNGFMDRVASRMANVLVGNADSEGLIEFCLIGPVLKFDEEANIAVCGGDFGIEVDGRTWPADRAVHVPAGETVRITTGTTGIYGSLAVGGGLDIPRVMGSRSTNLRCGIGGCQGRALMAGDVIRLHHPEQGKQDLSWRWVPERKLISPASRETACVRVIPGPQDAMFTQEGIRTFYGSTYEVTSRSDRMGYRLQGPPVETVSGSDILTDGIVNGSVQISGTGEPIVMMADRQTTGGYAKIATIISVDIPLFAQLRPGQNVRFQKCTVQEAQQLLRDSHRSWVEHCRMLDEMKQAMEQKEREAQALLEQQEREKRALLEQQRAEEERARELAREQEKQVRAALLAGLRQGGRRGGSIGTGNTDRKANAAGISGRDMPGVPSGKDPSRRGWQRIPLSERKRLQPSPARWRGRR